MCYAQLKLTSMWPCSVLCFLALVCLTNYSCACVGTLHTQLDTECSQQRLYVHLDSHQWKHVWMFSLFLITWSILTSALPTFLQASKPRGSEKYPFKCATASTSKDAEQSALHRQHSVRRPCRMTTSGWNETQSVPSFSRHNSKQRVKKKPT